MSDHDAVAVQGVDDHPIVRGDEADASFVTHVAGAGRTVGRPGLPAVGRPEEIAVITPFREVPTEEREPVARIEEVELDRGQDVAESIEDGLRELGLRPGLPTVDRAPDIDPTIGGIA